MQNDNQKFKIEFKNRLYSFVLKLIKFIDNLPKNDCTCKVIGMQLLRSGTSILGNYEEAKSASSKKDFINYFTTSLKSANESKVWLCLLKDAGKSNKTETDYLIKELTEISNILATSILTLKGRK